MIEYYIENPKLLSIKFEYDPYIARLVKKLPGWRFDGDDKKWMVPITPSLYDAIIVFEEETNETIPAHVIKSLIEMRDFRRHNFIGSSAIAPNYNDLDKISPLLRDVLRPYQQAGVLYMLKNRTVIVADDMGIGKTIEALATIESAIAYPALVICPASLRINWLRECEKWLTNRHAYILDKVYSLENKSLLVETNAAQIVITNYENLEKEKWLSSIPWASVIVDEAHYIKDQKSKRTNNVQAITRSAERIILMTGTPVINKPFDLVSLLQTTRKLHLFNGFWGFVREYCNAQKTRFGYDFNGAENLEELNQKLRECGYLRREKSEVLKDLPGKIRQNLSIEIDNRSEYEFAKHDLINYIKENRGNEQARRAMRAKVLVGINTLRQVTIEGKIRSINKWIEDFQETGKSLIVFGWHKEVLDFIANEFSCEVLNGETDINERQKIVDDFQSGETRMIVVNIQAGGVGLTLTAASYELFVELPWTNSALEQAEDRAHRIGQKETLNVYYAIGENTIDEMFVKMIAVKKGISEQATENTEEIDFLIRELLKEGE